jgi:hypothetical protein
MKFLMSSILVFSVMCSVFAGKFEISAAGKLLKAKNYTGVVEYVKANKECKTTYHKFMYVSYMLVEQGFINKAVTVQNFEETVDKLIVNSGITFTANEKILCKTFAFTNAQFANISRPNIKPAFLKFYTANSAVIDNALTSFNKLSMQLAVMFHMQPNQDLKRAFEYAILDARDANDARIKISVTAAKHLGPEYIDKLFQVITKAPTKRIYTAAQLNQIIELSKRLSEPKYDATVKALYIALKRSFYQNIVKGDDWKAAVTNLQLQMNAYGM